MLNRSGVDFPASIQITSLRLNFYGVFIAIGVISAAYYIEQQLAQSSIYHKLQVWEQLPWILLVAISGARLFHVISDWRIYQADPINAFSLWDGGLSFFGGILFGLLYIVWLLRSRKLPLIPLLAVIVVYIPLGQIIGRYGNFLNQELYGGPTQLPWAIDVGKVDLVHPTFMYEQLLNLILMCVVWYFYSKIKSIRSISQRFHGLVVIGTYLTGYAIVRLVSEQFRLDPDWLGIFSFGEVMAIILLLLGTGVLIISRYYQHD
jgi:phosphatidylglycerol:prolipoprotein diacylglycerol transferase